MKFIRAGLMGLMVVMAPMMAQARNTASLNAGWVFVRKDVPEASRTDFNDSNWARVTLPHALSASESYSGTSWYRRTLDLKSLPANARLYLQFDGAAGIGGVYVNGVALVRPETGTGFLRFDITRATKVGRNILSVQVMGAAGLYRGVSLIETKDAGIDLLNDSASGVSVRAVPVSATHADVSLITALRNSRSRVANLTVRTRIFSAEGQEVLSLSKGARLNPGQALGLAQTGRLRGPHLWNGRKDPYMYSVVTEVSDDNGLLDRVVTPFGVRTVAFDAQRGLMLNGQYIDLHGVAISAARAGKGRAVSPSDIVEDFDILDELGVNAIRLIDYPHVQRALDEADRRGIMVIGALDGANVQDAIRANLNHPGLIAWVVGPVATDGMVTLYPHTELPGLQTQLLGFERPPEGSLDAAAKVGTFMDQVHKRLPEKPVALIGYGVGGSLSHQQDSPGFETGWHPEAFQALYHEAIWAQVSSRPFVWGKFVALGFDQADGDLNEADQAGMDDRGLVAYDRRTKKDAFYVYKAQWSATPMVYVTGRRFTDRKAGRTDVKIYTNQPSVTLKVNGVVIATQTAQNRMVMFKNVALSEGLNAVVAEAGKVSDKVVWRLSAPVSALARPDRP